MRLSPVIVAAVVLVALSGCAASAPTGTSTPEPVADEVDWEAEFAQFIGAHGERPLPVAFEDPEVESARLRAAADRAWEGVLASHATAVRPEVPFVHWTTRAEHFDLESDVNRCLTEAGARLSLGTDAEGDASGLEASYPAGPTAATAVFACQFLAYPDQPLDGSAGAGWLWDFAAEFLVPCLEAHGAAQDPLPTREDEVAAVFEKGYGWVPRFPDSAIDVGPDTEVFAACHGEAL
jgi:hypothetical protein